MTTAENRLLEAIGLAQEAKERVSSEMTRDALEITIQQHRAAITAVKTLHSAYPTAQIDKTERAYIVNIPSLINQ